MKAIILVKRQIAEVSVVSKGRPAVSFHDVLGNLYVSIDIVLIKIEKHLRKIKASIPTSNCKTTGTFNNKG